MSVGPNSVSGPDVKADSLPLGYWICEIVDKEFKGHDRIIYIPCIGAIGNVIAFIK